MSLFTCIKISKLVGRGGVIRVCIYEKRMLCLYISLLLKFHGIELSVFCLQQNSPKSSIPWSLKSGIDKIAKDSRVFEYVFIKLLCIVFQLVN
jgi:hypothetical protein